MRANLEELARQTAIALANPAVRKDVYEALHSSRVREHKLHFQTFLGRRGARLAAGMATARQNGSTRQTVVRGLDSLIELEFYMPVPDHFSRWDGGENLIVVAQLHERDKPVGFDLAGRRIEGLTNDTPPETPALVIVRAEYRWASSPSFDELPVCEPQPDCESEGGGGGGGWSGGSSGGNNNPPSNQVTEGSWGFYEIVLDSLATNEDASEVITKTSFEGWTQGGPEFEIAVVHNPGAYTNIQYAPWRCASEHYGGAQGADFYRYWDDNQLGSLYERNTMLVDPDDLSGVPWRSHPVLIIVYEDDAGSCTNEPEDFPDVGDGDFFEDDDDFVGHLTLDFVHEGTYDRPPATSQRPHFSFLNVGGLEVEEPNFLKRLVLTFF